MLKKKLLIPLLILVQTESISAELSWGFKSPAFNGNGYSSHVLSTEQLLFNRQSEIRDKAEAEERRLERELENSTLNKFVKNLTAKLEILLPSN